MIIKGQNRLRPHAIKAEEYNFMSKFDADHTYEVSAENIGNGVDSKGKYNNHITIFTNESLFNIESITVFDTFAREMSLSLTYEKEIDDDVKRDKYKYYHIISKELKVILIELEDQLADIVSGELNHIGILINNEYGPIFRMKIEGKENLNYLLKRLVILKLANNPPFSKSMYEKFFRNVNNDKQIESGGLCPIYGPTEGGKSLLYNFLKAIHKSVHYRNIPIEKLTSSYYIQHLLTIKDSCQFISTCEYNSTGNTEMVDDVIKELPYNSSVFIDSLSPIAYFPRIFKGTYELMNIPEGGLGTKGIKNEFGLMLSSISKMCMNSNLLMFSVLNPKIKDESALKEYTDTVTSNTPYLIKCNPIDDQKGFKTINYSFRARECNEEIEMFKIMVDKNSNSFYIKHEKQIGTERVDGPYFMDEYKRFRKLEQLKVGKEGVSDVHESIKVIIEPEEVELLLNYDYTSLGTLRSLLNWYPCTINRTINNKLSNENALTIIKMYNDRITDVQNRRKFRTNFESCLEHTIKGDK